jgi:hypothetical protein
MNARHAAALALVGWYLMLPPPTVRKYPNPIDKTQLLSGWKKMDSSIATTIVTVP